MFDEIHDTIKEFAPIGLNDMGAVRLMSRIDTKYVVPLNKLNKVLKSLKDDYFVFEIHGLRSHLYNSLYYDTKDLKLYHRHHQGSLNRYKIRERSYVDSNLSFFEIKFKNNKKDTIKSRIKIDHINDSIENERDEFLQAISGLNGKDFTPSMWVNYKRITLVNKALNERATIDLGLTFIKDGKTVSYEDLVVIEAKREKATKNTPMLTALKENKIRAGGFSKYCLGQAATTSDLKSNRFKKKFLHINKLRKDNA